MSLYEKKYHKYELKYIHQGGYSTQKDKDKERDYLEQIYYYIRESTNDEQKENILKTIDIILRFYQKGYVEKSSVEVLRFGSWNKDISQYQDRYIKLFRIRYNKRDKQLNTLLDKIKEKYVSGDNEYIIKHIGEIKKTLKALLQIRYSSINLINLEEQVKLEKKLNQYDKNLKDSLIKRNLVLKNNQKEIDNLLEYIKIIDISTFEFHKTGIQKSVRKLIRLRREETDYHTERKEEVLQEKINDELSNFHNLKRERMERKERLEEEKELYEHYFEKYVELEVKFIEDCEEALHFLQTDLIWNKQYCGQQCINIEKSYRIKKGTCDGIVSRINKIKNIDGKKLNKYMTKKNKLLKKYKDVPKELEDKLLKKYEDIINNVSYIMKEIINKLVIKKKFMEEEIKLLEGMCRRLRKKILKFAKDKKIFKEYENRIKTLTKMLEDNNLWENTFSQERPSYDKYGDEDDFYDDEEEDDEPFDIRFENVFDGLKNYSSFIAPKT